jgi:hypothetical protein
MTPGLPFEFSFKLVSSSKLYSHPNSQPSSVMSSASPSHVLVSHKYATDGYLSSVGEIIVVRLSRDLFRPGSIIESSRNLPSRATRYNYHHAVVLGLSLGVSPETPEIAVVWYFEWDTMFTASESLEICIRHSFPTTANEQAQHR